MGFREGLRRAEFLFVFWRLDFSFIVLFSLSARTCDTGGNTASVRVFKVIILTLRTFTGEFRRAWSLDPSNLWPNACDGSGTLVPLLLHLKSPEHLQGHI